MAKCIFCFNENSSFERVEHVIPESLGNDDFVLPFGFVCDPCNQYFGSKIEQKVLNGYPFIVERIAAAVKTKKGKYPHHTFRDSQVMLYPTGYTDSLYIVGSFNIAESDKKIILPYELEQPSDILRFILKMGLEATCLTEDYDPYAPQFDMCRKHSRYGIPGIVWDIGYAVIAREKFNEIERAFGVLLPEQTLYRYELGKLINGDIIFSFIYRWHIFTVCLTSTSLREYGMYQKTYLQDLFDMTIIQTKI